MNDLQMKTSSGLTFFGFQNYMGKRGKIRFGAYYRKEMNAQNMGEFK